MLPTVLGTFQTFLNPCCIVSQSSGVIGQSRTSWHTFGTNLVTFDFPTKKRKANDKYLFSRGKVLQTYCHPQRHVKIRNFLLELSFNQ